MDNIALVTNVLLWSIVLTQGVFLLFLYRQVGLYHLGGAESRTRDGVPVGTEIPDVAVTMTRGEEPIRLGGKDEPPLMLVFASTHCQPCLALLPDLRSFSRSQDRIRIALALDAGLEEALNRLDPLVRQVSGWSILAATAVLLWGAL